MTSILHRYTGLHRLVRIITFCGAVALATDCSDSITGPGSDPQTKTNALSVFSCTATLSTHSVTCSQLADPLKPHYSISVGQSSADKRDEILIGGQHVNVDIISSNITNDAIQNRFAFDVKVKNLRPQPIGTTNGTESDGSLAVFFYSGPTTTLGSGAIQVINPSGVGTFTAGGQPYFSYPEMLPQNSTSANKNWVLGYDEGVQEFAFSLLVSANVPHPHGYIDVFASSDSVSVGNTLQVQDSVRDALGYASTTQTETWTSSDSTRATINSSGVLTGVSPGSVTVTATQGVRTGSMIVKIISPDGDSDGFSVAQGDCNDGDAAIHPGAADDPDSNFVDSNCDGIDGTKTASIFVAKTGVDGPSCGDYVSPCATILAGLTRAVAVPRNKVLIAAGTYSEAVTLANGVSVYGGYSTDFTVRSMANRAIINGSAQYLTTAIHYAIRGSNLTVPSVVDMVVVAGPSPTGQLADGTGKHSVGIFLDAINANILTISSSHIIAGNGSDGLAGVNGTSATQTAPNPGIDGGNGDEFTTSCNNTSKGLGGAAAGSDSAKGGKGGDGGTMDTDCGIFSSNFAATAGMPGDNATVHGTGFGNGGLGGTGGDQCGPAQAGDPGSEVDGSNGTGASSGVALVSGVIAQASGAAGALGKDGTGGGGGGGGGGCDEGTDAYGNGGGGGGAGGARATAAGGGGGGAGGSIGIYARMANPILVNDSITRGNGGTGGAGGAGGKGQPGSIGGKGGTGPGAAAGGKGGDGAAGGYSGAGGGGAGGMSTGILIDGGGATQTNVDISGGAAGNGGAGGARGDGAAGGTGAAGTLATTLIIS